MINQAKSDKNNNIFLNFVADMPGSRDIKISDNFFLSLNFSELARVSSLVIVNFAATNVSWSWFIKFICSLIHSDRDRDGSSFASFSVMLKFSFFSLLSPNPSISG